MTESEKTPKSPGSEKKHQMSIEPDQQQQAFQSRTPDLETTAWITEQLAKVGVASAGGNFQEALELLDAGLVKLQGRSDVRLWESMLLSKKHLLLNQLGWPEEAHLAKEKRDRLRETFEEWSKT